MKRPTKTDRRWWRVWCAVWRDIGAHVARVTAPLPARLDRGRRALAPLLAMAAIGALRPGKEPK